jgi:hypothetical protein
MESNEIVRENVLKIISNQLRLNKPPETKQTLERLKALGYSDLDAKKLIGQCLAVELFRILKNKTPYDETRYVTNLKNLPKEPFEEQL